MEADGIVADGDGLREIDDGLRELAEKIRRLATVPTASIVAMHRFVAMTDDVVSADCEPMDRMSALAYLRGVLDGLDVCRTAARGEDWQATCDGIEATLRRFMSGDIGGDE